jgi:capsular polysaccharide biosynthesis protein
VVLTAGDVYRALWRHRFFIVVLTAVFVGAAWYVTSRQTLTYEATALVRVQERGPNAGDAAGALQAAQSLAQTYAKIIDSGALKGEINRLVVNRPARGRVSEVKLSADAAQDSPLLTITARSGNPASATIVADAAPRALSSFIRRTGPRSEQIVAIETRSSSPVSRHMALNLAVALVIGLIFNSALALLIELFRDRLPEPEELGQAVGHPVLATIPVLRLNPVAPPAASPETEAVREIEQSLASQTAPHVPGHRVGPES